MDRRTLASLSLEPILTRLVQSSGTHGPSLSLKFARSRAVATSRRTSTGPSSSAPTSASRTAWSSRPTLSSILRTLSRISLSRSASSAARAGMYSSGVAASMFCSATTALYRTRLLGSASISFKAGTASLAWSLSLVSA